MSSIKVKPGSRCTLYEHANFGGKSWTIDGVNHHEFFSKGWADITSSWKCGPIPVYPICATFRGDKTTVVR